MKRIKRAKWSIAIIVAMILPFVIANANGPEPSVGLYWTLNADPTIAPGMSAPLWQLLFRTDVPSIWYKSGSTNTSWTKLSGVPGTGTVTSVACGLNMSCAPSPITGAGTVSTIASPTFANLTITGNTSVAGKIQQSQCDAGLLPAQTILNDWNPPCLATSGLTTVQGSDNSASVITGVDALDNALPIGTVWTLCNVSGPEDAAVLVFTNLDPASNASNRILTPNSGEGGRCSITTSASCHLTSQCPGAETCVIEQARYVIGNNQCEDLTYVHPWIMLGDATGVAWVVKGKARTVNLVTQNISFYPILFTDDTNGIVDNFNPTCVSAACKAAHTFTCAPGAVNCGEAGDDLTFMSNATVFLATTTGLTVKGFHYETQAKGPAGLGPYKQIFNGGPGNVTIKNSASATADFTIDDGGAGDSRADILLLPGQSIQIWHPRDAGSWYIVGGKRDAFFHERDVSMTKGLGITGTFDAAGAGVPAGLTVDNTAAGGTVARASIFSRDVGSYDTTAGGITNYGIRLIQNGTKSAGAQSLTNIGAYFSALSATAINYSLQTDTGIEQHNLGGGYSAFYGDLYLGSAILCSKIVPTANHGTLTAFSTSCRGAVSAVGAFTSVTLSGMNGYTSVVQCNVTVEGAGVESIGVNVDTTVTTAPVVNCWGTTTGLAVNCPNFNYSCQGY